MKQILPVEITGMNPTIVSGVTFARRSYHFPFYDYKDLKMDIIGPGMKEETARKFGRPYEKKPLFIWIGGGAWITMDRAILNPWLINFARRGWVVASVEYRMSNCAKMPGQLQDIRSAIRYLRAHADEFGIDPDRIAIGGESAGAHLAALAGVTGKMKTISTLSYPMGQEVRQETALDIGDYLEESCEVKAVADFYGPADFAVQTPALPGGAPSVVDCLLGFSANEHPEDAGNMSALAHISAASPAFFIIHGDKDPAVPYANSEKLHDALTECQVRADYYLVPGAVHADPRFYQDSVFEKLIAFLNETV